LAGLLVLLGLRGLPATVVLAASPASADPGGSSGHAAAASPAASQPQYVYSVGIIAGVNDRSLTLRFDGGQTQTYTVDGSTTLQTQNADAQQLTDLKLGNVALVLAAENDSHAVVVVNGGADGFHEATPADMRGD